MFVDKFLFPFISKFDPHLWKSYKKNRFKLFSAANTLHINKVEKFVSLEKTMEEENQKWDAPKETFVHIFFLSFFNTKTSM